MAQAADLKESPVPNPDNLGSADDVLSQLAGSEIDRLLAEAETAAATAPLPPLPKIEEKPQSISALTSPRVASAETELGLDEATLSSQLDQLFDQLQQDTAPAPPAPGPDLPAVSSVQPPVAVEKRVETPAASIAEAPVAPDATAAGEAPATEGDEKAALLEAAGFDAKEQKPEVAPTPQAAPAVAAEVKVEAPAAPAAAPVETSNSEKSAVLDAAGFENTGSDEGPLPIWIKVLMWINAPVNQAAPAVRQAMGRAAIVTLVNAVLVLSYLAISHKH